MAQFTSSTFDSVLIGTPGDDVLGGEHARLMTFPIPGVVVEPLTFGDDFISGRAGDDLLSGDARAQLEPPVGTFGGPTPFADALFGDEVGGNDVLQGGPGNDILLGDAGTLFGNAHGGNDSLLGGPGDDILYGDAVSGAAPSRADTPDGTILIWVPIEGTGSGGDDYLNGGQGNDLLVGDGHHPLGAGGDDVLLAGSGDDTLVGDFVLGANPGGDDQLFGGAGDDTLHGDFSEPAFASADIGQGGNDVLFGGPGDDTLHGGSGSDVMDGGTGEDTAVFDSDAGAFQIQSQGQLLLVTEIATGQTDIVTNVELLAFADVTIPVGDIL
jgi:Ca2+-binding RTX toxin-like protein